MGAGGAYFTKVIGVLSLAWAFVAAIPFAIAVSDGEAERQGSTVKRLLRESGLHNCDRYESSAAQQCREKRRALIQQFQNTDKSVQENLVDPTDSQTFGEGGQSDQMQQHSDIANDGANIELGKIEAAENTIDYATNGAAKAESGITSRISDLTNNPRISPQDISHDLQLFEKFRSARESKSDRPMSVDQAMQAKDPEVRKHLVDYVQYSNTQRAAETEKQRSETNYAELKKHSANSAQAAQRLNSTEEKSSETNYTSAAESAQSPRAGAHAAGEIGAPGPARASTEDREEFRSNLLPTDLDPFSQDAPRGKENLAGSKSLASAEGSSSESTSGGRDTAESDLSANGNDKSLRDQIRDRLARRLASTLQGEQSELAAALTGELGYENARGVDNDKELKEARENPQAYLSRKLGFSMSASETDKFIKDAIREFADQDAGILEGNSHSLFLRVKEYHNRCARQECVRLSKK